MRNIKKKKTKDEHEKNLFLGFRYGMKNFMDSFIKLVIYCVIGFFSSSVKLSAFKFISNMG